MFGAISRWRRRRVLQTAALPDGLWNEALGALPFLGTYTPDELARLRDLTVLFLDAKGIVGARGHEVTPLQRVLIALQACVPILNLDLALYDVRFETDAGGLVLAALLAAQQRGVQIRLMYNVDHPGPIPVPPPPETAPVAIEALPVATMPIPGIPDLMHHKFVVRDELDVWSGSTNWTDDSWSKQENVIVRVLGAQPLAHAFRLEFDALWAKPVVEHAGRVEPRPVNLGDAQMRPWFTPATARRCPTGSRSTSGRRRSASELRPRSSPPARSSARSSRS